MKKREENRRRERWKVKERGGGGRLGGEGLKKRKRFNNYKS